MTDGFGNKKKLFFIKNNDRSNMFTELKSLQEFGL